MWKRLCVISLLLFLATGCNQAGKSVSHGGASIPANSGPISVSDHPDNSAIFPQPQDQSAQIQKLQSEIDQLKKQKPQKIEFPVPTPPPDSSIGSSDVSTYIIGVGQVSCTSSAYISYGSGSLWNVTGIGYAVLTNQHVVANANSCSIYVDDSDHHKGGEYSLDLEHAKAWNQFTDLTVLPILGSNGFFSQVSPLSDLYYEMGEVRTCPDHIAQGSQVVVIGYPVSGKKIVNGPDGVGDEWFRIVTSGIISGYDSSVQKPLGNLPYSNYFVSAPIDSGNSGGIALSKDSSGLCLLGIPTWVNQGNFTNQGIVQNILNILYAGK